jgi:hypothetical protein
MLNQLKTDEFHIDEIEGIHHDAHIMTYQSQKMGIKVVLCNSDGIPMYDTVAPVSSYLNDTSHNM